MPSNRFSTLFRRNTSTPADVGTPTTTTANASQGATVVNGGTALNAKRASIRVVREDNTKASEAQSSAREGPKVVQEFRDHVKKGSIFPIDLGTLSSIADAIKHSEAIDDRKMLLEHALTFVSRMEPGHFATTVQNKIVELLYNDLAHPPATAIGNNYAWRTADGSFNNVDIPNMGKAGTPYARSVQQSHPLPKNQLPDPGLIFDTLLKRKEFVKHPAGLSSMMFSFAALVIHSVFRTSHYDVNINETSSYVDLSPLYGHNQEAQDRVRVRDGRGLLLPDVFAEDRLLLLPPAVCAILVLFSRNHNYIAKRLLEINERGTYVDPAKLSSDNPAMKTQLLAQEEELFQIARLINCGWFASVVFSDYFSCILGLVRDGSSWSLNPFDEIRNSDHSVFERGKGNVCSVEFNCLYRWHATTSVEDEQWVGEVFSQLFDGKAPEDISVNDFKGAARKIQAMQPDITHWTFGKLERQADGTFNDSDLANILHNATEHPAASFGARGTPAVMRLHEVMGIEQNRRWGVCSLNDFRKYLGLRPYTTFREWNPDPEVADAAEKLYGDIDHLELYVGLQAEDTKPVVEGAGLCPGYTISRAILSDAIALTRGDRFFTHDYTPFNLTAWGFNDCQRDPTAFGFGSTLGRLFLRTLPNNFTENSTYTFFPLMTPDAMQTNLTKLGVIDQYDMGRPGIKQQVEPVTDYGVVKAILENSENFHQTYSERVQRIIEGDGFYVGEGPQKQAAVVTVLSTQGMQDSAHRFFNEATRSLIASNSFALVGGNVHVVDIVRDVIKVAVVSWVSTEIAGIPLKTKEHAHGVYSAAQLYEMLTEIYNFVFLEGDSAAVMVTQRKARANVRELLRHIKGHLGITVGQMVAAVFTKGGNPQQQDLIKRLQDLGNSSDELANLVLAIMVLATGDLSLVLTNMVNLYLGSEHDAQLRTLSRSTTLKNELDGYAFESLRIDPTFKGAYRVARKDETVGHFAVKAGQRIFLDVAAADRNAKVFPDPAVSNIRRDAGATAYGDGAFRYLGQPLTIKIMTGVLRAVFGYDNVRRAPGQSGVLPRFRDHAHQELAFAYVNKASLVSPWPTSLSVQFQHSK